VAFRGSCAQNNKKSKNAAGKGNPKNREKQIQELLNHLYTDRPITGCQSTQTNKKKPLYLRGKKRAFFC
jgi:hypothetical protein